MHSDQKTFCVGVDINRFYQSIIDKDVTNVQEVYYDGAQALYEKYGSCHYSLYQYNAVDQPLPQHLILLLIHVTLKFQSHSLL